MSWLATISVVGTARSRWSSRRGSTARQARNPCPRSSCRSVPAPRRGEVEAGLPGNAVADDALDLSHRPVCSPRASKPKVPSTCCRCWPSARMTCPCPSRSSRSSATRPAGRSRSASPSATSRCLRCRVETDSQIARLHGHRRADEGDRDRQGRGPRPIDEIDGQIQHLRRVLVIRRQPAIDLQRFGIEAEQISSADRWRRASLATNRVSLPKEGPVLRRQQQARSPPICASKPLPAVPSGPSALARAITGR